MAIPILHFWDKYFSNPDEGLGSTYERFIINRILYKAVKHFQIKTVLEAPSFGFTGMSGINSMGLALKGCEVSLLDHDMDRLDNIKETWKTLNLPLRAEYIDDYSHLNFPDKSFDMSWNFSALWFVKDLQMFLSELDRVTKSIIIIMVPNQTGLGYVQQRYFGQEDLEKYLIESHIRPKTIKAEMEKLNWKLLHHELLDCPLWPDIGMSKEDFLKKLGLGAFSFKKDDNKIEKRPITILDYYSGRNLDMPRQFEKYELFEQHAPESFKRFWAHHQYLLFIR